MQSANEQKSKSKRHRCSLYCNSFFHKTYSQGGCALRGLKCQEFGDEGSVLLQALEMDGLVIGSAVLPHAPEYFQPSFTQATQCAGMAVPIFTFGCVVNLSPKTGPATLIGPKVDGVAQEAVASPANARFTKLSGLKAHRTGSRAATQALRAGKRVALASQFAQQTRSQFVFGARQTAEDIMIGMVLEGGSDPLPIFINLLLKTLQHIHQAQRQERFGTAHRGAGVQLLATLPGRQNFCVCRKLSQRRLPALPRACGVGKFRRKAQAKGLVQSSKLSSASG